MARIPKPRTGKRVSIKGKPLPFSLWPMYRGTRRYGLQSHLYVTNPWAVIEGSIKRRCPLGPQAEAIASARQAEQFFKASSEAQLWASKPLLAYYSFLNLAKAFALTEGLRPTYDKAKHGLFEHLRPPGRELVDAVLTVYSSPDRKGVPQIFAEFLKAISGTAVVKEADYDLTALLPQIVTGHRLWCEAADERERFAAFADIDIMQNESTKSLWIDFRVFEDKLTELDMTRSALLTESRLDIGWKDVRGDKDPVAGRHVLRFEQTSVSTYTARPSDEIPRVVRNVRSYIWSTVTTVPPHRKYFLYFCPATEHSQVMPQVASIYAVFYYLGSVTRYRPQQFDTLLNGPFGEHLQEVMTNVPSQFLYLIASEFAQRDVTRAAIV